GLCQRYASLAELGFRPYVIDHQPDLGDRLLSVAVDDFDVGNRDHTGHGKSGNAQKRAGNVRPDASAPNFHDGAGVLGLGRDRGAGLQQFVADRTHDVALVDAIEILFLDEDRRAGEGRKVDLVERLIDGVRDQKLFRGGPGRVRLFRGGATA